MFKKLRFLLLLISFSTCVGLMSNTYSRYAADTTQNIDVLFARWQILVNNADITNNSNSSITFEPVIEANEYVASNVIAPTSKGYFDIDIDPTNVDVAFTYLINLSINNTNIPDLMVTKYSIIDENTVTETKLDLVNNEITNDVAMNSNPFTVRVYFEWYDENDNVMDDTSDTAIGSEAATSDLKFTINADISFVQKI